jgi:hypothetical protein
MPHANATMKNNAIAMAQNLTNEFIRRDAWTEGLLGNDIDLLKAIPEKDICRITDHAFFLFYVIFFLALEVPVYFDVSEPSLRENLLYYSIKGDLPY